MPAGTIEGLLVRQTAAIFFGGSDIPTSAYKVTCAILDGLPAGSIFTGIDLQRAVHAETGAYHFPATMLRYLRMYRQENHREILCIKRSKSKYMIMDEPRPILELDGNA